MNWMKFFCEDESWQKVYYFWESEIETLNFYLIIYFKLFDLFIELLFF